MRIPRSALLLSILAAIGCNDPASPGNGEVRITVAAYGLDPDPDGYVVTIDGASANTFSGSGSVRLDVESGEHTFELGGLASNCIPTTAAEQSITVYPGETSEITFGVRCTAITGIVEVQIQTTGLDPDGDGYVLSLDAGSAKTVLPTSLTLFSPVAGGSHSISLFESAPNCSPVGANPVEVNVEVGGLVREVAHVTIFVRCTAASGVIEVRAPTTGPDADLDGYGVSLDGGDALTIVPNGVLWFTGVPGGEHIVHFSGLALNCGGAGPNPQPVTVEVGGAVRDTAHVSLAVTCTATTGAVRVTVETTGPSPDPSYSVLIDGGSATPLVGAGPLVIGRLAPGNRSVQLTDVAPNCEVGDPNPVSALVAVGDTVDVQFSVTCVAAPRTGVDVTLTTAGVDPGATLDLYVYGSDCGYYYCNSAWTGPVPANGIVHLDLPADAYYFFLATPADCSGNTSGNFNVSFGQVTSLNLQLSCVPPGTVVVSVPASGVDVDPGYYITVDGNYGDYVAAGGSVSLSVSPGSRSIRLNDVAGNCVVGGSNPVTVDVTSGGTTNLTFPVTCVENPTLHVSVPTTGTNQPAGYLIGVDSDYYYGYLYTANVLPNGSASIKLPPGFHYVTLDQVPSNCTVTPGPNNVPVTVPLGATTELVFTVVCS